MEERVTTHSWMMSRQSKCKTTLVVVRALTRSAGPRLTQPSLVLECVGLLAPSSDVCPIPRSVLDARLTFRFAGFLHACEVVVGAPASGEWLVFFGHARFGCQCVPSSCNAPNHLRTRIGNRNEFPHFSAWPSIPFISELSVNHSHSALSCAYSG